MPSPTIPNAVKRTDMVLGTLREEIVSGRLPRGTRLPNEKELARQYGVSQPTIREVIRALDAMGLIDVRHGSGVFVRGDSAFMVASALQTMLQIEKVSILEVLEVRELLGRGSITQAAENATDAEIEELREKLAVLEDPTGLADVQSVIEAIADFQRSISAAAHNPLLLALESVLITLLLHIQITALRAKDAKFWQRRSLEYQHHRRDMVAAIAARRPKRALTAMDAYLEHQRRAFTEDSKLSLIRLSDADAVRTSLDIVSAVRAV